MSPKLRLRLGTRGSLLALTQSRWVAQRIEAAGGIVVELETVRTTGDLIQDRPLSEIGGKGLFTRELDVALLEGRIDLAVHSLKDLPTELPPGISVGAIPEREDPRDVLIGRTEGRTTLESLEPGARIGTSSLRRAALLRATRSDLQVMEVRGNIDTRIRKVDDGELDGVVLAAAGVRRLGWGERVSEYLGPESWLPAPGQGALAVVVRTDDLPGCDWLGTLEHPVTRAAVTAERSLLHRLEGGCRLPVAALGLPFGGGLRLKGMVADPDGHRVVRAEATGSRDGARLLGVSVGERLLELGADLLLSGLREAKTGEGG